MGRQIPMVDYLVLDEGEPHLVSKVCESCGALYFDRRNACGKCGETSFGVKSLSNEGSVRAFTIVHRAAPGVPTPYISAIVDLEGGGVVKSNIVGLDPSPDNVKLGMPVRLTTYAAGSDDESTEAVAFGYTPV